MTTKPRYRLMIEGAPTEWVTDGSLETTVSDGRVRRQGLLYEGLDIKEEVDLREATTNVSGMSIKVRSENANAEFAYHPGYLGFLASDIDYDDSSLTLDTNTGLVSVADVIHIGTEALKVTSVTTVTIGVTRQYWDTQAQGHYRGVEDKTKYVPIYNRVPSYEGRRVFLFRYDEGDTSDESNLFDFGSDYQGSTVDTSDTVVYRGIISRPPTLDSDGLTWILDVEPITFLLEQEIATAEVEFSIKGIYHHSMCGLAIICTDYDVGPGQKNYGTVRGYHPTEEDFIKAVNDELATLRTTAFTNTPQTLSFGWSDEGYRIDMTSNATATYSNISITIASPLVGVTGIEGHMDQWKDADTGAIYITRYPLSSIPANKRVYSVVDAACTRAIFGVYEAPRSRGVADDKPTMGDLSTVKSVLAYMSGSRCILGTPASHINKEFRDQIQDTSQNTTYPFYRMYIDNDPGTSLVAGSYVLISGTYNGYDIQAHCRVLAKGQDATHNTTYISVVSQDPDFRGAFPITAASTMTIVSDYGTRKNIAGFIDNVVDAAVYANKGTTPFITASDIDVLSFLALAAALPQDWAFRFSNAITLHDVIKEHLKLYGWYMHLNSVGEIAFAPFEAITDTDGTTVATIDGDYIITPPQGDFPRWEPANDGVVNVVEIARGYDWVEDSFDEAAKLTIRDVLSISTHKNRSRGMTTIEPRGMFLGTGGDISNEKAYDLATVYLGLHSHDYDVVEMDVTSDIFDVVQCSSLVKVTSPHILNSATGTRGITNKVGVVIAKAYSLDPSKGAAGKITVRLDRDAATGYAPAMRATARSVYSGSEYTVTVTATYFAPTGTNDTAFFTVGDKVRVTEFKSGTSPNNETGAITAIVSTTSVRINMDGSFPVSASGVWDVEYDDDDGSLNDGQNNYCYVADSNGLLYDDTIGRRFA